MTLVSVIIPAHNEERHITSCIESLLKQNYRAIEIIILDNNSKDRTGEIVKSFSESHSGKIRYIKLDQNYGPGGARNIGAKIANGEVLLFLDADMVFPEDYVMKLAEPIIRNMAISATHSEELIANLDNPWVKVQGQVKKSLRIGRVRAGVARAVRKDFFLKYGGFDPKLHYHDDRTLFYKTGVEALVVHEAYCLHNNPDTAREILRRNYWIGRTYIATTLRENGVKGFFHVVRTAIIRFIDLTAIPFTASWLIYRSTDASTPLLEAIPIAQLLIFTLFTAKMKIVNAESFREKIILRFLYAPAYRIVRAVGLMAGLAVSIIRGLTVKPRAQTNTPRAT